MQFCETAPWFLVLGPIVSVFFPVGWIAQLDEACVISHLVNLQDAWMEINRKETRGLYPIIHS